MARPKISIIKETTHSIDLSFKNGATPVNITGWTIYFTVKADVSDSDVSNSDANALIQKTIATHIDAANGKSVIPLTKDDTNIPATDYVFDIKWDDGSGNVQGSDYGTFTIRVDVTRRA